MKQEPVPAPMNTGTYVPGACACFGEFTLDCQSGELISSAKRIRLTPQLSRLLELFLNNSGRLVSKMEIGAAVWPAKSGKDLEQSLFTGIKRLRDALGDKLRQPRYLETRSRRGYIFLCQVEWTGRNQTPFVLTNAMRSDAPGAVGPRGIKSRISMLWSAITNGSRQQLKRWRSLVRIV